MNRVAYSTEEFGDPFVSRDRRVRLTAWDALKLKRLEPGGARWVLAEENLERTNEHAVTWA